MITNRRLRNPTLRTREEGPVGVVVSRMKVESRTWHAKRRDQVLIVHRRPIGRQRRAHLLCELCVVGQTRHFDRGKVHRRTHPSSKQRLRGILGGNGGRKRGGRARSREGCLRDARRRG